MNYDTPYVGHAAGQLVFRPNSNKHAARMFVWMGVRDPREVMHRANNLMNAEYLYCCVMIFTGQIALLFASGGAAMMAESVNDPTWNGNAGFHPAVYFIMMSLSLMWLYGMKLIHGYILHAATRDLPLARKVYDYRWYWPMTMRSSLRMTYLFKNWRLNRTGGEKAIGMVGTLLWCAFIKVPLYFCVGVAVVCTIQTGWAVLQ